MNTAIVASNRSAIDEQKAVDVITMAFSADPICRWAFPDPHVYLSVFPEFVRAFAGRAFEYGTAHESGGYKGVALWLPPGVHPDEDALAEIVSASISADLQEPLVALMEQQEACHPREPHWYLPLIGVDPAAQRQGHGSRLLERILSVCDLESRPAYLEATTVESRALYERHGFEVVATVQVPGSPLMWPMVREPRNR